MRRSTYTCPGAEAAIAQIDEDPHVRRAKDDCDLNRMGDRIFDRTMIGIDANRPCHSLRGFPRRPFHLIRGDTKAGTLMPAHSSVRLILMTSALLCPKVAAGDPCAYRGA